MASFVAGSSSMRACRRCAESAAIPCPFAPRCCWLALIPASLHASTAPHLLLLTASERIIPTATTPAPVSFPQGRALPLGLVLSYINYGTRCGLVPSGDYLATEVDEEGDVGQAATPEPEARGTRPAGGVGSGTQVAEAGLAAGADIAACLAGALRAAYHLWSEVDQSLARQSASGAGQRSGPVRGLGLIGKVDIDGSVDLFSEAVMAAGGTVARARVYADVAAALANLGASSSSAELWELLSKGLLQVPLQDLEAKTVVVILNALARSR